MAVICFGCGAQVPDLAGPSHAYIGASPGCWKLYGDVLAREYGEFRYPPVHRMTVDAYAAQHPGIPGPKAVRSVATHLIALCLMLERNASFETTTETMRRALARAPNFRWLDPPKPGDGDMTILDVVPASNLDDHTKRVRHWASSVWRAWSPHHVTVRAWLDEARR